jgi:predicted ATPase/DNA-binding winged helix-turn-helix (wHTH) protein
MYTSPSSYRPGDLADPIDAAGVAYLFGSFRLIPSRQILLDCDSRVPLGSRALDLLTALVEHCGELITKRELMARAWPQTVVEESNLKVHIAALRKALAGGPQDQQFIATVVGRGYQFVAPVEREVLSANSWPPKTDSHDSHHIPVSDIAFECGFEFGPFRLLPARQLLLNGEEPVRIGNRAMEILIALVERPGDLLTKRELMTRAWPKAVVEESNLKVQIAALRRALGEGRDNERYLATAAGRGYRFVAPVTRSVPSPCLQKGATQSATENNLPASIVRPIGRLNIIRTLLERLQLVRMLTVTGPGGIGKTNLALAIGQALSGQCQHNIWFIDLSTLSDSRLVPNAVASVVGVAADTYDVTSSLINYFRGKRQLVILDSCEHVIDAAAILAERILAGGPDMLVLATSREPLLAAGEYVYRLNPLPSPLADGCLTVREALQYPTVELFMERAAATQDGMCLSDDDVSAIGEICWRLEGVPLAIELAAARIGAFGPRELLGLLEDEFETPGPGRRTAPERHRSIVATLDWSYQLLSSVEKIILRRLSVFAGSFVLGSAGAIVSGGSIDLHQVIDGIASLYAKSLVSADLSGPITRYWLLDSTRDYARRKLAEADEISFVARRYAEHFGDTYVIAEKRREAHPDERRSEDHARRKDDAQATLD